MASTINHNIEGTGSNFPISFAESDKGMIVGTTGLPAIHAALKALKGGASAVDAVMMAALVQTALAAGSWDSYAGTMSLVYYEAQRQEIHTMNAAYKTVANETDPLSIPGAGTPSGRTVLVPGFMAGVQAAHEKFGTLPFPALFEAAIKLAEDGFIIDSTMDRLLQRRQDVLLRLPEGREIFLKDRRVLYRQGDLFRQPLLAGTLRDIAAYGANHMYEGAWADKFVDAVGKEGGKITRQDLQAYQVIWSEPLRARYGEYDVFAPGIPSLGGVQIVEALNLLECANLAQHGHYTNSPYALYWLIQITHVAYLSVGIEPNWRVSKERARRLWAEMLRRGGLITLSEAVIPAGVVHSDGVVAIDSRGNIASLCHSSNTNAWGTTGIFVDGVSIPDSACFQQDAIKRAGPGARLPDPMNPVIVLQGSHPILASSCVGASLHELMIQSLTNILDCGMRPKEVTETSVFMLPEWPWILRVLGARSTYLWAVAQWCSLLITYFVRLFGGFSGVFALKQMVEPGAFSQEILESVAAMGQRFKAVAQEPPAGYWAGIRIDRDGTKRGAVTARGGGTAVGY